MSRDRYVSETTFYVRYAETDNMGVVHHAVYLVWFEEGRSAYIREHGWSYAEIEKNGYFLAAAELKARYRRAARYDQLVTVKTWIHDFKSRTLTFGCEIVDGQSEMVMFESTLKLICLNAMGEVTRVPEAWHSWLNP
ncbi:MAG: thioesterase family protein [Chloroflexi bacterium]|nr:thioesterase family protein [Chloroflexota bacterium]